MRLKKYIDTDKLDFEYFVNISKEGIFTAYLPEDVITKLEKCGIKVAYGRGSRKGYFEAKSLEEIESDIYEVVKKFSDKKLILTKIVLRYQIITSCSYCKTKKGEIVPNGSWQQKIDKGKDYKWFSGTHEQNSNNAQPFGFSVYVEPQRLNIYSFPDKTQFNEYVNLKEDEIKEGSTLDWLNSVCGMAELGEDEDSIKDIDYSEEVGIFFKNIILYICKLNERLKDIFGDEIEITKAKTLLLNKL